MRAATVVQLLQDLFYVLFACFILLVIAPLAYVLGLCVVLSYPLASLLLAAGVQVAQVKC